MKPISDIGLCIDEPLGYTLLFSLILVFGFECDGKTVISTMTCLPAIKNTPIFSCYTPQDADVSPVVLYVKHISKFPTIRPVNPL